jgi:hypothetical protein
VIIAKWKLVFICSIVFNSMIFGTIYWCCGAWTCLKTPKCSYMHCKYKTPNEGQWTILFELNVKLVKTFWSLVSFLMSCDRIKLFVILINIVLMTLKVWGMDRHSWLQYFQLPWHWQRFIEWFRKFHEVVTFIVNTLFPCFSTFQDTTHHVVNIFNTPFKIFCCFSSN